jgi:hypothetical protein
VFVCSDHDVRNNRAAVFTSIQLMKRAMNEISRKTKREVPGNFESEETEVKRALEHARAFNAATKCDVQDSITYDLMYAIDKLRTIQINAAEEQQRQHLRFHTEEGKGTASIFVDPTHNDYDAMDRMLEAGLKQLQDRDQRESRDHNTIINSSPGSPKPGGDSPDSSKSLVVARVYFVCANDVYCLFVSRFVQESKAPRP